MRKQKRSFQDTGLPGAIGPDENVHSWIKRDTDIAQAAKALNPQRLKLHQLRPANKNAGVSEDNSGVANEDRPLSGNHEIPL